VQGELFGSAQHDLAEVAREKDDGAIADALGESSAQEAERIAPLGDTSREKAFVARGKSRLWPRQAESGLHRIPRSPIVTNVKVGADPAQQELGRSRRNCPGLGIP
jgi:hypothetical protein